MRGCGQNLGRTPADERRVRARRRELSTSGARRPGRDRATNLAVVRPERATAAARWVAQAWPGRRRAAGVDENEVSRAATAGRRRGCSLSSQAPTRAATTAATGRAQGKQAP